MARIEGKTDQAPTPVAPYSQAVRIANTVAAAGQAGNDHVTGTFAGEDVGSQTAQTFKNIAAVLASA